MGERLNVPWPRIQILHSLLGMFIRRLFLRGEDQAQTTARLAERMDRISSDSSSIHGLFGKEDGLLI